ncbi:MAG TPA: hypothetical protein VFV66_08055 [Nonomuraea sp.]|nr:hypothetical protein [Nonomuraea sp.]
MTGMGSAGEADFDPDRTISVTRPKGTFPPQPDHGQPPGDEGSITTMRIQNSPGQQVYPLPPSHQRQHPMPPQPGMPQQPGMPPRQPVPPGGVEGQGLGTDLFAIAGQPEQKPAGNRNGMLVLMAVAAAAAVVIAVLIVALFSS